VNPDGYEGAHGAIADINATAEVLLAQLERFSLQDKAWTDLDPDRAKWVGPSGHLVWRDSGKDGIVVTFGKYKGKDIAEMDDWYTNMITEKDFPTHVQDVCRQLKVIRKQRIPMPSKAIAIWAKERFS
jgi:DNA polymerase-3 subunit epsilon